MLCGGYVQTEQCGNTRKTESNKASHKLKFEDKVRLIRSKFSLILNHIPRNTFDQQQDGGWKKSEGKQQEDFLEQCFWVWPPSFNFVVVFSDKYFPFLPKLYDYKEYPESSFLRSKP